MRKLDNLKWGVLLTYITLFLNIVISVVYTPIMLRLLGPSEHGLYSTVSSTMSWLGLLSLGFSSSYIRFHSIYKVQNDEQKIANLNGLFLLIFTLLGSLALISGIIVSNNLRLIFAEGLSNTQYVTARLLAIVLAFNTAVSFPEVVFGAYIKANEKYIQVKAVNLMQCILKPLITLPLLYGGFGSPAMVLVSLGVDIFAYSLNIFYCFKTLKMQIKFNELDKDLFKQIFVFSLFIAINMLIDKLNTGLDKILITRYFNTTHASVYAIGFSLFTYYSSFANPISSVLAPRINRITNTYREDKKALSENLTQQFVKVGRIQFYVQMLMCTGIVFFGKRFIYFWAGNGYEKSYTIAVILSIIYTIPLCQNIGIEIQRAQNKHKYRTLTYAIATIINLVLTILLCPIYGEVGAVIGTAISCFLVDNIFMNWFYNKALHVNVREFWKQIGRISVGLILPVFIGGITYHLINRMTLCQLAIGIIIYVIIYLGSMWVFALNTTEKQLVASKITNIVHKA